MLCLIFRFFFFFFFFQAEDGIRDLTVTGVQTCALPISSNGIQFSCFRNSPMPLFCPGRKCGTWCRSVPPFSANDEPVQFSVLGPALRSEERRVGKECRSRWSPDH